MSTWGVSMHPHFERCVATPYSAVLHALHPSKTQILNAVSVVPITPNKDYITIYLLGGIIMRSGMQTCTWKKMSNNRHVAIQTFGKAKI